MVFDNPVTVVHGARYCPGVDLSVIALWHGH